MSDLHASAEPTKSAPPLLGGRPLPTAVLPETRRNGRQVSAVPPTAPPIEHLGRPGVASRLVPEDGGRRRLTSDELLRIATGLGRVVALAIGVALAYSNRNDLTNGEMALLSVAALATVLRVFLSTRAVGVVTAEMLFVAAILYLGQGTDGPFALFGAASAVSLGATGGMALGLTSAAVLAGVGLLAGPGLQVASEELALVLAGIALYPVGAALGALLSNVLQSQQATLQGTNRILADLERLTTLAPKSLSPAVVATSAAAEFRRALDGRVGIVLFEREGTLLELGRDGPGDAGPHLVLDDGWEDLVRNPRPRSVDIGSFPVQLTRQLPVIPDWVVIPLRSRDTRVGLVLVGCDAVDDSRPTRALLREMAVDTALALDNTQLFARIEQSATAAERQRLASDLHDGVAQQLTHVRFELELLARRTEDEASRAELQRLARVAHRATDDVRAAIRGLQAAALDEGLVPALRALVADLDGASGPDIELDIRGAAEFDPDVGAELYRIVQEALSNALRHANASEVVVEMDVVDDTLVVVVEDDGVGTESAVAAGREGLGLRTMRARSQRIGGSFVIRDADDRGTRVEVRLPLREAAP